MIQSSYGTYSNSPSTNNSSSGGSSANRRFGRVVDVIIDTFHPKYEQYGKSQSLNGVLYRQLDRGTNEEEEEELLFAYCGNSKIKTLPLKGEIVKIESMEIASIKTMFYVVKMEQSKLTIRVPIEKQEEVGLRKISSKKIHRDESKFF